MVGSGVWVRSAVALSLGVGHRSDGRTHSQHVDAGLILCMFSITMLSCPSEHFALRIKVYSFNTTVLSV